MEKKPNKTGKRVLQVIGAVVLVIILAVLGLFAVLTITEYKPEYSEKAAVDTAVEMPKPAEGEELTLLTWNIGYGALGAATDFFMDGGTGVRTATKDEVGRNLQSIAAEIKETDPDIIFLQEVDRKSARSHKINEEETLVNALNTASDLKYLSAFAYNYKTLFVPYPLPPLGRIEAGLLTLSDIGFDSFERIQLPCPFSWPVRLANLKRCLLINRIPVTDPNGNDTGKELVLVNLHLEAYDSGEGKAAQTAMLKEILEAEAAKGNYVIAGGDFNQTFSSVDDSMYPEYPDKWHCGEIDVSGFSGFEFLMDNTVPTCRSLDQSYAEADKENFQYYMIDGFIVSDNLKVNSLETIDLGFENTDHNPVVVSLTLTEHN